MRIKEKFENVGERDRIGDNVRERAKKGCRQCARACEKVVYINNAEFNPLLPPLLHPNLPLALRITV